MSNYNAVQITGQRRLHSLTVLANYTYSKSLDDIPYNQTNTNASTSNNSPIPSTSPYRHAFDYGPSDYDRRQIAVLSYVYDFPQFSRHGAFLRTAVGGWETTGILRHVSGIPFTVLAGSDRAQTGLNTDRAQVSAGANLYANTGCVTLPCVGFLNQSAFTVPAIGTSGNLGKDSLLGPSATNWDVGLLKNFALGSERCHLQFHAEFFNVLNKTNLLNPIATISSAGFGTITSSSDPRIGQLALKLTY